MCHLDEAEFWNHQLRTYDWRRPPQRITLAKLATEICKIIKQVVEVRLHTPLGRTAR